MKKFHLLTVLLLALFMFSGFESNAQQYYPASKAYSIVLETVNSIKDGPDSPLYMKAGVTPTNADRLALQKIKVGERLIELLKNNSSTAAVLNQVFADMPTSGQASRAQMKNELELFSRNLLKLQD